MKYVLTTILVFTCGILSIGTAAKGRNVETGPHIELSTKQFRLRIRADGRCAALIDLRDGKDYLADENVPFASLVHAGRTHDASSPLPSVQSILTTPRFKTWNTTVATRRIDIPLKRNAPGQLAVKPLALEPKDVSARYVRFRAESVGKLPDWHPSADNPAWLFADEIVLR